MEDSGVEDVMAVMFEIRSLEDARDEGRETEMDSYEDLLLWFTKMYIKFLSANDFPICKNYLLRSKL